MSLMIVDGMKWKSSSSSKMTWPTESSTTEEQRNKLEKEMMGSDLGFHTYINYKLKEKLIIYSM